MVNRGSAATFRPTCFMPQKLRRPATDAPKANLVMEISTDHPITNKLKSLYESDKNALSKYAKLLFAQSCLIAGIQVDDTAELCELISDLMLK